MPSLKARIKITSKCKNNCWYCYASEKDGEMSHKIMIDTALLLKKEFETGKYSRIKIAITGGDPFSTNEIIFLIKLLNAVFYNTKKLIFSEVCYYADMKKVKEFKKLGGVCLVSLNENDINYMINIIKQLDNSILNIVLTPKNIKRIDKIAQAIIDNNILFRLNHLYTKNLSLSECEKILSAIDKFYLTILDSDYKLFSKKSPNFSNIRLNNPSHRFCGYGKNYLFIYPNGDVSRCQLEQPITNIYDPNIMHSIYKNINLKVCENCSVFDICKGGCCVINSELTYCEIIKRAISYMKLLEMKSKTVL